MKLKRPDYDNSILNVSNSFLKHYNIKTNYNGVPELDKELENNYNHIVYILLDGMGLNIVNTLLDKEDALRKYVKKPITSVFPPTTVAATNAVLSGVPPIVNGYVGWVQYFKNEDTDLTVFLNQDFYTGKTFDESIRDKYLSFDNITTQINKSNPDVITNIIFPGFIDGSTVETFKDETEKALMILHNTDQSFSYLYWTQPDLTEHVKGIYSTETKNMLKGLNKDFEDFINEIPESTLVVVIADHGLTDIIEFDVRQEEKLLSYLKRQPSIEPRAINFFVKEEHLNDFELEFNRIFEGKYILLTKDDLFKSDLFGRGEKHELIDMFIGDYMGIAVNNTLISLNDKKTYKAHHAGLTEDEMIVPLIIYTKK